MRSAAGCVKPRLPWLESLPSFCTGCGSKAPNSSGHQRRLPTKLHSRTTEFPPTSGNQRPCRDAGVGAIAPGFAMLERAKRASHVDPPASSYAIMRKEGPYRGENPAPGKDVEGELEPRPGIREQPGSSTTYAVKAARSLCPLRPESGYKADSYPGRLETRDRLRFLGGLACEEVLQDIFAIRRGERLLANFATQQVIKRLGLRLYPYHLVVRSTLRTGEAGGIVMHRYQARSGSSHHLPLSCSSALS